MIDITKLTENDIGRWVVFIDSCGQEECGRIKSWNKENIFVVYLCNNKWNKFKNYTGAATNPEDLRFFQEDE